MKLLPHMTEEFKNKFWSNVDIRGEDDCWDWKRGCVKGYGCTSIRVEGKNTSLRAHRVAWMITNNMEIADGLQVRHSCDNRPCCNPKHLLLGTNLDNQLDAIARGRHAAAKLTEAKVKDIKLLLLSGYTQAAIAERFGVRPITIWNIKHGKAWQHVTL